MCKVLFNLFDPMIDFSIVLSILSIGDGYDIEVTSYSRIFFLL